MGMRVGLQHAVLWAAASAAQILPSAASRAADKYWDINATTPGAGSHPTGAWNTSASNWNTDPLGGTDGSVTTWTAGDRAVFCAGSDAVSYTVTLAATQSASAVLVKDGTLAIGNSGTIDTGAGTFTIGAGAGSTARVLLPGSTRLNSGGKVLLDGGALVSTNTVSLAAFINAAKDLEITSAGGAVGFDDGSGANNFATIYTGTISGVGGTSANGGIGTLTKTGPDEFRYQATAITGSNVANTSFAKLAVNQGLYRLGSVTLSGSQLTTETGFGAAPLSYIPDAITLSNGGAIGASFGISLHPNRGIALGSGGGAFNTTQGTMTIPSQITGAGNLLKNTTGTLNLTGDNKSAGWTGKAVITAGILNIAGDDALGAIPANPIMDAIQLAGGTLGATADTTIHPYRGITLAGGGTITTASAIHYSGRITGTGPLTKGGAGTLALGGTLNDFTGDMKVMGGMLQLDDDHALPASATLIIDPTASSVAISAGGGSAFTRSIANNISVLPSVSHGADLSAPAGGMFHLNGQISGAGTLSRGDRGGEGIVALNADNSTWTGSIVLEQGILAAGHKNAIGVGPVIVMPISNDLRPQLQASAPGLVGQNAIANEIRIRHTVTVNPEVNANTLVLGGNNDFELSGTIINDDPNDAGAVIKDGSSVVILSGANTYSGATTIQAGRLQVARPDALPGYNMAGKVVVTGGGTLGVNAATNNGWTQSDIDAVRSQATFDIGSSLGIDTTSAGGSFTYGSNIDGVLGITKLGVGALVLTANSNSWSGSTRVESGTLQLTRIHPGTAVSIADGAKLKVDDSAPTFPSHPAGDDARVSQPRSLAISGAGALDLGNNDMIINYSAGSPYAGVSPAADLEDLVSQGFNGGDWLGAGITSSAAASEDAAGSFVLGIADNATLPQPYGVSNGGENFDGVDVPVECVLVKFTHRADLNLDGLVTDTDAIIFSTNYEAGAPATWSIGDLDYDGAFSDSDAIIFGTFFDASLVHLPEPASSGVTAALLLFAIWNQVSRRGNRQ